MKWNLLENSCKTTGTRKSHDRFSKYISVKRDVCFCSDIANLFQVLGNGHEPNDWCHFMDTSSQCLTCVLLHSGNQDPSIPIGCYVHVKESYENANVFLELMITTCTNGRYIAISKYPATQEDS